MLRCPPSLITLNNTDILDFELRTTARLPTPFTATTAATRHSNIRLSSVPTRTPQLAITTAEDNFGRKRAASSASQATVCCTDDDDNDEADADATSPLGLWAIATPSDVPKHPRPAGSELCREAARALEEYSRRQPRVLDGATDETRTNHSGRPLCSKSSATPTVADHSLRFINALTLNARAVELRPAASLAHSRDIYNPSFPSRNGLPILHPIQHDAYPTTVPPPALSSARARRRRHARSHDDNIPITIYSSPPELQHRIQDLHFTRRSPEVAGALNPDAPVFIPRTRYAAALESRHSSSSLRIRSSAERNIESAGSARLPLRRSNDRITAELLRPGLVRLPFLGDVGRGDGASHHAAGPTRLSRPLPPLHTTAQMSGNGGGGGDSSSASHRHHITGSVAIQPRTSSLAHRLANGVNTGIASAAALPQSSTTTTTEAAAAAAAAVSQDTMTQEFFLMRNSPLDELAERLSRVRPRSVGRSWERPPPPPGNRTSALLAGDLFRMETPPSPSSQGAVQPSSSSTLLGGVGGMGSPIKRKPVPVTTPKVQVYDDSLPPATQPRTPADFGGARRARGRSDIVHQQAPPLPSSSRDVALPPGRHQHRHTYPAEAAENDVLDAHLVGLEEDRRRWAGRRWEDGSLEVTPPREGRFERFLS